MFKNMNVNSGALTWKELCTISYLVNKRKLNKSLRELSFLILGTGVEEFLEGCQTYWPCFIGLPNIFINS